MQIIQAAPDVYKLEATLGSRRLAQWLFVGNERSVLVDTGVPGTVDDVILPALAEIGVDPAQPLEVLISHADVDHYGGNADLRTRRPDARIRAHVDDRRLLEHWSTIDAERYGWFRRYELDYDPEMRAFIEAAAGPDTPLDASVVDGEVVELGAGDAIVVVHLPGHSPGHLGFWHAASRVLVVIDAILERGLYDVDDVLISPPPYVDAPGYRASIERVANLRPERLGTAHYADPVGWTAVEEFLAASLAFDNALAGVVAEQLDDRPRPLADFWHTAERALGPFSQAQVELARSAGAHLDLLVATGQAEEIHSNGVPAWRRT